MALTVDEIAEILNAMRVENEHNVNGFEKALTGINNKLEMLADDNEATDLIKVYISELRKSVEDKHNTAVARFNNLENSFKNIISSQNNLAKTSEIRDLFQVLSTNVSAFSEEISEQKNTLDKLDEKLENISSDTSDKDEITSLIDSVKTDLASLNNSFENSFSRINSNLSNAVNTLENIDFSEYANEIKNDLSNLSAQVMSIPSQISFAGLENKISDFQGILDSLREVISDSSAQSTGVIGEKFNRLEASFENIVTDSDFAGFKKDLADFVQKIIDNSTALNSELNYTTDRIEHILSTVNSMDFREDFESVTDKIAELKSIVNENLSEFGQVKSLITEASDNNIKRVEQLENSLANIVNEDDFLTFKRDLGDLVEKIVSNSTALNSELNYSVQKIESVLDAVNGMSFESDFNALSSEIDSLKALVNVFSTENKDKLISLQNDLSDIVSENDFNDFKDELNALIDKVLDSSTVHTSELSFQTSKLEDILTSVNSISFDGDFGSLKEDIQELKNILSGEAQKNEFQFERLESALSTIVTDSDFEGFKADLADFVQKIIDNSTALNSELNYTTERIENILTTVKTLDFRDDFENVIVKINDIKEVFEDGSKVNYSNLSREISEMSERMQESFVQLNDYEKETFASLKDELSVIVENIHSIIEASPQKSIDELTGITAQISDTVNGLKISVANNLEGSFDELKSTLNSVISNLQIVKDDIVSQNENSNEAVNNNFSGIENQLNSIVIDLGNLRADISESNTLEPAQLVDALEKTSNDISDLIASYNENSNSNYDAIKDYAEELISSVNNLQTEFNVIASNNASKIITNIENVSLNINALREEFKQTVAADLENSSKIYENIDTVSQKVDTLYDNLSDGAYENFNVLKELIEQLSVDIVGTQNALSEESKLNDEQKLDEIKKLSDAIKNIENIINASSGKVEAVLLNNVQEVKDYIAEVSNSLYESQSGSETKVIEKLGVLETVTHNFEASFAAIKMSVDNVLNSIVELDSTEQNDIIKNELNKINNSSNNIISAIDIFNSKSDNLSAMISDLTQLINSKDEYTAVSHKIDEVSQVIESLKDLVSSSSSDAANNILDRLNNVEENISKIVTYDELSVFKGELAGLIQRIIDNTGVLNLNSDANKELIAELGNKIDSINFKSDFERISDKINEIAESFDNTSKLNYGNLVSAINEVKGEIIERDNYSNIAWKLDSFTEVFDTLKNLISSGAESSSNQPVLEELKEFKNSFEKIITNDDFVVFKDEFASYIQRLIDNISVLNIDIAGNKELISQVLAQVTSVDYSSDFEQIGEKINQASETLSEKISSVSDIVASVKDVIVSSTDYSYGKISSQFEVFEENISKIMTSEDFSNFKTEFSDFIQRILDNSNILNINSTENKFKISQILERFNSIDYSGDLENIAERITAIKDSFENNSKMNYDNLVNEINNLNEQIQTSISNLDGSRKEAYESLKTRIDDLTYNIQFIRDNTTQRHEEILNKISSELSAVVEELQENLTSDVRTNFADIQVSVANMLSELHEIKNDIESKTDANAFNISAGFDVVKISMENLLSAFNGLNETCSNTASENAGNILENINEISAKVDDLKQGINQASEDYCERILTNISDVSEKIDAVSANVSQDVADNLSALKEMFISLSDGLQSSQSEYVQHVKDGHDLQMTELQNITGNVQNFRAHVDEVIESLRNYIAELNLASKSSKSLSDSKFSEKLLDLESALTSGADIYSEKMETLQGKLSEYVQNVEARSLETEAKLDVSLTEMSSVKDELASINDIIKASKISADDNFSETISVIDSSIENIMINISGITDSVLNGVNSSLKDNIDAVDEKFESLLSSIEDAKKSNADSNIALISDLEEKIAALKQEIGLVNTDIAEAIQAKAEEITRTFEPLKTEMEEFLGFDFNTILENLKSQIEQSFVNFSVDVNGEFAANSEAVSRLEQAYKETFNRISAIEECVSDKIINNIELLNLTVETNARDIKNVFEEKLDEYIGDLKSHIDESLNDTDAKTLNSIDNLKDELSVKLDAMLTEQSIINAQNNEISANVSTFGDDIKNYVQTACENTIDKYSPVQAKESLETLHQKFDMLVASTDNEEVISSIEDFKEQVENHKKNLIEIINGLSSKVDVIAEDDSIKASIDEITDKINEISDDDTLNSSLQMLSEKVDVIATDTSLEELQDTLNDAINALNEKIDIIASDSGVEELHEKFDEFSESEDKVAEMLAVLHEKVDVLALDGAEFDLEEEIDDIKNLIFEQRKYFDAASGEKAAAIDQYLRDLLIKIDNVDLEKNSEDIKESIMTAILSLTDQISFVEETEEIKDFVEEKTDEINQHLLEVRNQLKQIASAGDDDYSYTLQDVETDIAKLRIALSEVSPTGENFGSLSQNINKIVKSVEGLENTLTQDQVFDLKTDIEKLNEDILSLSSRTNKLLLTSDDSYKSLRDGLDTFSNLVYKLDERINNFGNTQVSERLDHKLDKLTSLMNSSLNADKVFHQVMMYLGEWIDSTTENISSISEKTSEINGIKETIQELKDALPDKTEVLEELENRFEQQELRIDRLEMKLEKILSTLEEKDDMVLNRKVDKIEKMLSRLGTNIEKLASYVDEE